MNDYLYANLPTANTTSNKISTTTPQTTESARAHFHELIDHLMQLEISDIDASLPKITLTDCSSVGSGAFEGSHAPVDVVQRTTDDNAFAFEFNNAYQSNNFSAYNNKYAATQQTEQKLHEPLVQSTTRHNGFTLKQTKFIGTLQSSLDIPDEGFYYNSEARPP
uniref:Uncharacterized protein n=2 Tax=Ceratitis capitata TaxID=7213 RepID=W8AN49_CERCA